MQGQQPSVVKNIYQNKQPGGEQTVRFPRWGKSSFLKQEGVCGGRRPQNTEPQEAELHRRLRSPQNLDPARCLFLKITQPVPPW